MVSGQTSKQRERESAERFDPDTMGGSLMEAEHRARYWWAGPWVPGKEVLDAGCGVGYGLALLAERDPARLVGVDVAAEALERAGGAPAELVQADLRELPLESDSFDVVVCFEVIEHVEGHERVLDELRRVLRPGGTLLISSPNRDVYAPGNPHHVHEFLPDELREVLAMRFDHVALYGQHSLLASAIVDGEEVQRGRLGRVEGVSIQPLEPGRETYILAVASDAPVEDSDGVVTLGDAFEVRWWHEELDRVRAEAREAEREFNRRVLMLEQEVARVRQLEHELDLATRELSATSADLALRGQVIQDLQASLSWKLTSPLRLVKRLLR
jgi:SAM-dependent methyltransferase